MPLYTVHDVPDNDKIISLNDIVKKFGHNINNQNRTTLSKSLNNLLKNVKANPSNKW